MSNASPPGCIPFPRKRVALVQLPFPSQEDPEPSLGRYYELYARLYSHVLPGYKLQQGDLWELPLWVAHLDGALGLEDTLFVDLSREPAQAQACVRALRRQL